MMKYIIILCLVFVCNVVWGERCKTKYEFESGESFHCDRESGHLGVCGNWSSMVICSECGEKAAHHVCKTLREEINILKDRISNLEQNLIEFGNAILLDLKDYENHVHK